MVGARHNGNRELVVNSGPVRPIISFPQSTLSKSHAKVNI